MIRHTRGDILAADCQAIVNPVNCVGVMGKGLALQFKQKYPECFYSYRDACMAGEVKIGQIHIYATGRLGPRYILNFPTKDHWRDPSLIEYIELGLMDLVRVIGERRITSIAVPAIGTGLGGLPWTEVLPKIEEALSFVQADVLIFDPF